MMKFKRAYVKRNKMKKHHNRIHNGVFVSTAALITFITLLSACAPTSIGTATSLETSVMNEKTEPTKQDTTLTQDNLALAKVYEVGIHEDSVRFLAVSTGCTSASNFALKVSYVSDENNSVTELAITLLKPDYCKAMPRIVSINMPIDFAITGDLKILNPDLEVPDFKTRKSSNGT